MKKSKYTVRRMLIFFFILCVVTVGFNGFLTAAPASQAEMTKAIDTYLSEKYPATEPGIAVLAVKDGKIILRKGYGLANLELGVAIKPEMVFRLGSISKQFTAAAIMKLVEEGKVALDDEITKYIPDYPTHGTKITVHHLLNHTSGIKSYTGMAEWLPLMRKDMSLTELIALFKDQPMDFKPGEKWLYNNSGYILLGAIIEKASGTTYEDFINERIFKPLGMKDSYYGNMAPITPNRVAGYEMDSKGFRNADYISMTQPYAAGSLLSTVDDLYIWNKALFTGKVVREKSFQLMTTPTTLADGSTQNYGYGLMMNEFFGEKMISHGGGINGFSTQSIRIPGKDVFVTVFSNCPGQKPGADFVAQWIAALLCGKEVNKKAIVLDRKILEEVVGSYQIAEGQLRTITLEGDQLYSTRTGGSTIKVFPMSATEFFYEDSLSHFKIVRDDSGKVIKMIMSGPGPDSEAMKTDKKPTAYHEIKLQDPATFDAYAGIYEEAHGLKFYLRREEAKYFFRVEGQPEVEIFPQSETEFFLKVVDAHFEMIKDSMGKVTGLTFHQGPITLEMKKK